jgi:putative FmdB family regulatory protein
VPTYQYRCTECGEPLEAVQAFTDDALTECPACGGRLRKVFSAVGVVFKGSGFYRTDSRATKDGAGKGSADGDSAGKGSDSAADKPAATKEPAAAGASSGSSAGSSSSSSSSGGSSTSSSTGASSPS